MYETVIGLEVHLHLKTKTKAFCDCLNEFGNEPNTQVCPVCLGFPGSLPVYNKTALEYAIKTALALNCRVQEFTKFDRKNYYYPDLPKNYQISQYDLPLSRNGFIKINSGGRTKSIGITRVHMEEDAGKLVHEGDMSLVDFNRAGVPLLEIVSEPQINSPQEAHDYLSALKGILEYLEVSDCDMEKGSLRCDANISLRKSGAKEFGVKTELKNMNSFKAVKDALSFEVARQKEILDDGGVVVQETRLWDERAAQTVVMRTKEGSQDYRYFPEPDLPPLIIQKSQIEEAREGIPELPQEKLTRFMRDYGLLEYDAKIIVASKKDADFAEECFKAYTEKDKKPITNWFIGPLATEGNLRSCPISALGVSVRDLIDLIGILGRQEISNLMAKSVLTEMIESRKPPAQIIQEKGLIQVSDEVWLSGIMEEVIKENSKVVADYKSGKANSIMFLVGQVMKKSQLKANPKAVQDMLRRRLDNA